MFIVSLKNRNGNFRNKYSEEETTVVFSQNERVKMNALA